MMPSHTSWVEISKPNLLRNVKQFKKLCGKSVILAPCVKANAYGHGLVESSRIIVSAGADWLCVNALFEAEILRKQGIKSPIYIVGYVEKKDLAEALRLNCRLVVYNKETILHLAKAAEKLNKRTPVHIKVETGNNRQGVLMNELADFAAYIKQFPRIKVEGAATHFANIEDTVDTSYAEYQLKNLHEGIQILKNAGINVPIRHCANSAASILFPKTYFEMVRPGIAIYGLWPSEEVKQVSIKKKCQIELKPVLSWKTKIAQIKEIPKGAYVGYGCTYKTSRKTKLAILPVGYYDGYDRGLSNKSYVVIRGKRAPVRGRVCMNIIMVDTTDIPEAKLEDTAILIGRDKGAEITTDQLAKFADTINYEITTRINENVPRFITTV